MSEEIGEIGGIKVMVSPEAFEEIRKQKIIEENKILRDLQQKVEQLENIRKEAILWINKAIEIIKMQPSGNDEWILERLNGFIHILNKGSDNNG